MAFFYGYDENNKKVYYDTKNNGFSFTVVEDEAPLSETLEFKSFNDELKYYGFTDTEILNINNKINSVNDSVDSVPPTSSTNPITGVTSTSQKGSLLTNSAQALKNNTDYQKARIETEKAKIKAIQAQNEIQKKQLDMMDYNLTLNGLIFSQLFDLTEATKAQTEAIKNQKLIGGDTSIKIDTSSMSEANIKIAEGVESQKLVNEKLLQKLNQELTKDIDFEGKTYSKSEIEKLKDLETLKNVKDENETLLNDSLELIEDFLTDGFDLSYNPIDFIMNNIKESIQEESQIIKTKYNLKQSEV